MQSRHLIFCFLLAGLALFTGCVPGFRAESEYLEYRRGVVLRERQLLTERARRLSRRIGRLERQQEEVGHLRVRLGRMERVIGILSRKLAEGGPTVVLTRRQWRLAYNAGCRFRP